jgi:hypothetical protein
MQQTSTVPAQGLYEHLEILIGRTVLSAIGTGLVGKCVKEYDEAIGILWKSADFKALPKEKQGQLFDCTDNISNLLFMISETVNTGMCDNYLSYHVDRAKELMDNMASTIGQIDTFLKMHNPPAKSKANRRQLKIKAA